MTSRAAILILTLLGTAAGAVAQGMPTAVSLTTVRESEISSEISAVGPLEARTRTILAARVDGRVAAPPLREGSVVRTGESEDDRTVVCELDRTDREISLREAKAALDAAKARQEKMEAGTRKEVIAAARAAVADRQALLDNAEATLERTKKLFETKVTNRSDLDAATAAHLSARSTLTRAKADLSLAEAGFRAEEVAEARAEARRLQAAYDHIEDELGKTRVRSPVNGVVVRRLTEVGNWVSRGGPVAEIVDLSTVLVRTSVTERDVARIRNGDAATVTVDAFADRAFEGKVSAVVPAAEPGTRTFRVWIELPNEDRALADGMFARVSIRPGGTRRVLLVPKDAVILTNRGSVVFAMVPGDPGPDGKPGLPNAVAVPVEVGEAVGDAYVLRKGEIKPGMPIVLEGNEKLSPMRPSPIIPAGAPPGGGPGGGRPEGEGGR